VHRPPTLAADPRRSSCPLSVARKRRSLAAARRRGAPRTKVTSGIVWSQPLGPLSFGMGGLLHACTPSDLRKHPKYPAVLGLPSTYIYTHILKPPLHPPRGGGGASGEAERKDRTFVNTIHTWDHPPSPSQPPYLLGSRVICVRLQVQYCNRTMVRIADRLFCLVRAYRSVLAADRRLTNLARSWYSRVHAFLLLFRAEPRVSAVS
jgi:hypothetical protein